MATLIDSLVGEYRVLRQLGEGGMGQVFEAVHPVIGKHVAVKVLRLELAQDERLVRRFIEEARAVTAIRHHSIVDVFGFGTLPDGRLYLVMDLLVGESFSDYLRAEGPLEPEVARRWLLELFDAVAAAHQAGVVHRDLKPSNLFLVGATGEERLKVLDFGIARREERNEALTRPNVLLGSPAYIAPEQIRGEASQASDLYSIGCIAWAMLTGRTLFRGEILDVLNQHLMTPAPAPSSVVPSVPPALDDFVLWLLEKEPADRPESARAARDTLAALSLEGGDAAPRPPRVTDRTDLLAPARTSVTATAPPLPNGALGPETQAFSAEATGAPRRFAATATPLPNVEGNPRTATAPAMTRDSSTRETRAALEAVTSAELAEVPSALEAPGATLGEEHTFDRSVVPGRGRIFVAVGVLAAVAAVTTIALSSSSSPAPVPSPPVVLVPPPPREPSPPPEAPVPPTEPTPVATPPTVGPVAVTPASPPDAPERRVIVKPVAERPPNRVATRPPEKTPTADAPAGDRLARTATQAELETRLARDEAAVSAGRAKGGKNAALLLEDARANLGTRLTADERINLQSFLDEWEQRYLPR